MVMSNTEIQLVPFTVEEGWKENSPTRDVYDCLSSEDVTREMYEDLADNGSLAEATFVLSTAFARQLRLFLDGSPYGERETIFKSLMQLWATDPWRCIPWNDVLRLLPGPGFSSYEPVLYQLFKILWENDTWKTVLENCRKGGDTCLREWAENHCLIWVDNREMRRFPGPLDPFPRALIQHYVGAVDWAAVTRRFRSDRLQ